ncbi:MAG TPA: ERCC4 domain-containing protein [Verrucomicrobiae bacterium]|nr:ERCC4 domain-containing protein [Verrucomicrobiae bacterium]
MKKPRTLISSPLDWQLMVDPVAAPLVPVTAERGGTQLKTPRPVLLVDTREQNPFDFAPFEGWFSGIKEKALKLGDYSIAGLEDICLVERKGLADLVGSCTTIRGVFVKRLKRMAQVPHRLLVITSPLSEVKSEYGHGGNPNRVTQSLVAMLAGLQIPFLCTETHELGAEIVASYLYQVHLYHWLESNGHGRYLADNDL